MKITQKRLIKLIQEAMYNPRARRDAVLDRLNDEESEMIRSMIDDPNYGDMGNEMLHSIGGYEPSPEFPDATSYTEEISQFDQKMRDSWRQHWKEGRMKPKDLALRKLIVDYLFDPMGIWRIPVDRLNPNTKHPDGLFKMDFEEWDQIIPKHYVGPFYHNWGENPEFEARAEKVFNSMGGSYYQGDGATLVPLSGITQHDQIRFNQIILKVLNGDPEYV